MAERGAATATVAPTNGLKEALAYAALGWHVFPLHAMLNGRCSCGRQCTSPAKHPITVNGVKAATTDTRQITAWWTRYPWANIGVATGSISGFIAVDIDPKNGGEASLEDLIIKNGEMPVTVEAITGSGGRHILFKHPGGHIGNRTNLFPGVDIRGDGGYIVVAPSNHPSGNHYVWHRSPRNTPLAQLPFWLYSLLQSSHTGNRKPVTEWRKLVQGVQEGERNQTVASLTGHLLAKGVDPWVTVQLVLAWNAQCNEPPLSDDEVLKTINSIAGRELRKRKRKRGGGSKCKTS